MTVRNPQDLPTEFGCLQCDETKPLDKMCVVHLKSERVYYVRPRCKDCHNKKERGHRRDWKRNYLRDWRKANRKLNDSYWKDNADVREKARINAALRLQDQETHEAVLIQGRLRRRLDQHISLDEAKRLLARFGRCYPTRFGLTKEGLRECERIRKKGARRRFSLIEIRMMLYEDGYFIAPDKQPLPYQAQAEKLRKWQAEQRELRAA